MYVLCVTGKTLLSTHSVEEQRYVWRAVYAVCIRAHNRDRPMAFFLKSGGLVSTEGFFRNCRVLFFQNFDFIVFS